MIFLVAEQVGGLGNSGAIWKRVYEIADSSKAFQLLVFTMTVAILVSVRYAIRNARDAWLLEESIRRQTRTTEEAERVLRGKQAPSERRLVSVMSVSIAGFGDQLSRTRPNDLIPWLNEYFDRAYVSCMNCGGYIDKYSATDMCLVFGIRGGQNFFGRRH